MSTLRSVTVHVIHPDTLEQDVAREDDPGLDASRYSTSNSCVGSTARPSTSTCLQDGSTRSGPARSAAVGGIRSSAREDWRKRRTLATSSRQARLGQVVVGAALGPTTLSFSSRLAGGQHQDRHIGVRSFAPDGAAHRDAIDFRQHEIGTTRRRGSEPANLSADSPSTAVGDLKAFGVRGEGDQLANVGLILDDEGSAFGTSGLSGGPCSCAQAYDCSPRKIVTAALPKR